MVVSMRRYRYWTILTSLLVIILIYLLSVINVSNVNNNFENIKNYPSGVKTIVSYSLLKQIENESEQYSCGGQLSLSGNNYGAIKESVEVNNNSRGEDEDNTWTNIDGSALYISSVHLDKRLDPYHYIRIIGMIKGNLTETFYCLISTTEGTYHVMKVTINSIWTENWNQDDNNTYFNPVLLSCRVPQGKIARSVRINTKPCKKSIPTHTFLVNENNRNKKSIFTVCVKPLDLVEDISRRLIQWIEICRILGADKIEIYVGKVKKNVRRVLRWYSTTFPDEIVINTFKRVKETGNETFTTEVYSKKIWQKRRYEIVAYNNCFYRNIHTSQFVIPLDVDEIIVPKSAFTWKDFLTNIFISTPGLEDNFASFTAPNTYFFEKFKHSQGSVFFLTNTKRTSFSPAGESGKSFISTKNALTVFNHYALDNLKPGTSRTYFLSSNIVQLNHYKEHCNAVILPECLKYFSSHMFKDTIMLKYSKVFMIKYKQRLDQIRSLGILL